MSANRRVLESILHLLQRLDADEVLVHLRTKGVLCDRANQRNAQHSAKEQLESFARAVMVCGDITRMDAFIVSIAEYVEDRQKEVLHLICNYQEIHRRGSSLPTDSGADFKGYGGSEFVYLGQLEAYQSSQDDYHVR